MWSRNSSDTNNSNSTISVDASSNNRMDISEANKIIDEQLEISPERSIPSFPIVNREACKDSVSIRNFLKLSRSNTDDMIRTRLNNYLNHHEQRKSILFKLNSLNANKSKESQCLFFLKTVIYPQWEVRANTINLCYKESENLVKEVENSELVKLSDEEKIKLLRDDPYALKDIQREIDSKYDVVNTMKSWTQNEIGIEEIIKKRSCDITYDICDFSKEKIDIIKEFNNWVNEITK
ncbi:hypothetical protein B5S31_g2845 [[Candida] boidinii]|nr:hypothetical protein B5S31_g2845 [[Candida] boidinii]GME72228.1 unnamed protein product [[Candida] boidinii]